MSIHRRTRGNGTTAWIVRWKDSAGQRSRSFDRKADAETFERERRRRAQFGPAFGHELNRRQTTLDDFVRTGFRAYAATLAPASRRLYGWALTNHLQELLDEPLVALTVPRLAEHQQHLLEHGRTINTVRQAMVKLSGILQIAVEHGHIAANPVHSLRKVPAEQRDEVRALAPEQLEQLIGALAGRDRILVVLAGYFGLRPLEARMAAWAAVGDGTFTVGRARTKRSAARTRTLSGPDAAFHELRTWRMASGRPDAHEPIVGPMTASALNQWTWKVLQPVARSVLGEEITLYTLRHTHASALHYCGFTVPAAARRLGHGGPLHLRTYAHVIDALEGRPRYADLDALIAAAREPGRHTSSIATPQNR